MNKRVEASIALGIAALGLAASAGTPAVAAATRDPKVSASISNDRTDPTDCSIKWSASNLVAGQTYNVGIYDNGALVNWAGSVTANDRGVIRTTYQSAYSYDTTKTFTADLVTKGTDVVATDSNVISRCTQ